MGGYGRGDGMKSGWGVLRLGGWLGLCVCAFVKENIIH